MVHISNYYIYINITHETLYWVRLLSKANQWHKLAAFRHVNIVSRTCYGSTGTETKADFTEFACRWQRPERTARLQLTKRQQ